MLTIGTRKWAAGLVSAAAGSILTALLNMGIAPESFNVDSSGGIKKLLAVMGLALIISVLNYLKQYPAPEDQLKGG